MLVNHPQKIIQSYLDNRIRLIKIKKYSTMPLEEDWQSRLETSDNGEIDVWLEGGGNIGAMCGTHSNGLIAFVIHARPHYSIKSDLQFYRSFGTLINFSRNGFQVIYRTENRERAEMLFSNFYDLDYAVDSIRYTDQYILLPPSKVEGKFYWSLDEGMTPIKQI